MFSWKENIENRLDPRKRRKDQIEIDMEKIGELAINRRKSWKIRGPFGKQLVRSYTKRNIIQLVVSI